MKVLLSQRRGAQRFRLASRWRSPWCSSGSNHYRFRSGVAEAILLRELGVLSPERVWLRSTLRFWNVLVGAPAGSLHRAVAVSDWPEAVDGRVQKWA